MGKYIVTLDYLTAHEFEIEAESADDARERFTEWWDAGRPWQAGIVETDFPMFEIEVDEVDEVEEAAIRAAAADIKVIETPA